MVLLIAGLVLGGRPGFYINGTGIHSARENDSSRPYVQEKMKLDGFTAIDIDINYADLEILPSDGYYIEYQLYGGNPKPVLEVKNQKLRFKEGAPSGFMGFNFFSISGFGTETYPCYVTLYVPADQYFTSVSLKNDDGSINMGSISAESMEIRDDYGDVRLEGYKGGRLKAYMGSGAFRADNLEADDVSISSEYGMVNLGLAEPLEAYKLDLETEYGIIKVPGFPDITIGKDDTRSFKYTVDTDNVVKVRCDSGDIVIEVK